MASNNSEKKDNTLVIVESPAKARTISKFLGSDYTVEASIGHIRDLPSGAKEVPEKYKGEDWAYLGVNVNEGFEPVYIVPADKKKQVTRLKTALKECDQLYLATDEDREGEAISWHLVELLKPKVTIQRLVFHEITREAIQEALDSPRDIDQGLVRAQETRRILDRLYGYDVSPLLWRKVRPRLSAGRVQSVAVRLIVEREKARMAFHSAVYWDLAGTFATQEKKTFDANLVSINGQRTPSGKDFDPATGLLKNPDLVQMNQEQADQLVERLKAAQFKVVSVENKPYTSKPYAPFTTSTLQQEANRKLNFTARRTMSVAQSLYENGHITYMRTDSTTLAAVAIDAARDLVSSEYGEKFLPDQPRQYQSKVKNAQEAHEAIRPAGHPFELPSVLQQKLTPDEYKLFVLIWKRTIASQMADARGHRTVITLEGDGVIFQVSGKTIDFPGYLRAYVEGADDPDVELADQEKSLPSVHEGELLDCVDLTGREHVTQPPSRFSEAALTRTLEEKGIGRPSTYASIIDTILARQYVFKKGNALVPTWVAFAVVRLLEDNLSMLVDYKFTAEMEDDLDAISRGEVEASDYLKQFYFGNGRPGLKSQLENKIKEIEARDINRFSLGTPEEGEYKEEIFVRVGRFGPFLEQGERRAGLREEMAPDEVNLTMALELLDRAALGDEPLGDDPETGRPVYLKEGRFGPYVQLGLLEDEEEPPVEEEDVKPTKKKKKKAKKAAKKKPKNASLLKGMAVEDINLEVALKLLTLPRNLGEHPESKEAVMAYNGRFGPYVKCAEETRSLPADVSPIEVDLPQALALLAQPKAKGRGRAAAKEPIKTFDPSPVTEQPVKLLEGRYGPYVTDGETNASLPRGSEASELTFEQALDLLAERAAKGPSKKKKKKATKKKAAKKKTAKKTAKKKAAKKKVTRKKTTSKKGATKKATAKKAPVKKSPPSGDTGGLLTDDESAPF